MNENPMSFLSQEDQIEWKLVLMRWAWNERERRLHSGQMAKIATEMGMRGEKIVSRLLRISEKTVKKGLKELEQGTPEIPVGRIRRPGAGRHRNEAAKAVLLALVKDELVVKMGQKRVKQSLRSLQKALAQRGYCVSYGTVFHWLLEEKIYPAASWSRLPESNFLTNVDSLVPAQSIQHNIKYKKILCKYSFSKQTDNL